MKKFLLGIAALACAASMSAASYTVFDISTPGIWTGDANGWTSTTTAGGQTFVITTNKGASSTDLISPVANTYAWRVYKQSSFTIDASFAMKSIVITYDDYNSGQYCVSLDLSAGWTGSLDGTEFTAVSAGLNSVTMTASNGQARIKTVVASDDEGTGPVTPPDQDPNVVYENTFESSIADWTILNDESLSDFNGWKINNSETAPKCAICNSYYGGAPHPADSRLQKTFDLTGRTDCELSVAQAFGYDFPTVQVPEYTLYIECNGDTRELAFSNFPAKPESSNWSKFAENTFDLSEFDGETITLGFRYRNDGSKSGAWELKNFKLTGNTPGSVAGIDAEEIAPVYYNLQGVRVENPTPGLYIVVKGSKSSKVLF